MIRRPGLSLIKTVAETLRRERAPGPWPALSLSYQDVIATDEELADLFGAAAKRLPIRPDSAEVLRWHKCGAINDKVPDWHELLRHLGFDPTSTDLLPARGCEAFLDLNHGIPPRYAEAYMLVIDNVAHHCFDAAQALRNIVRMPRVGGFVLHVTPLAIINHGFYCLSPTLFHDFYTANGYETVAHLRFDTTRTGTAGEVSEIGDPTYRIADASLNSMQLYLARRTGLVRPTRIPTQTKFQNHPKSLRAPS